MFFVAAVLVGVSLFAYETGHTALQEATIADLRSMAVEKQAALEAWIEERQLDVTTIAAMPRLREDVSALLAQEPGAQGRIVQALRPWDEHHGFLSLLIVERQSGQVVAATQEEELGQFKEDRSYFVRGQQGPYVQGPYHSVTLQSPAMTAAVPIESREGELLAVLVGRLDLQEIETTIRRRSGLHRTDDAYLVNTSNLFVTQPRFIPDPAVLRLGVHTPQVERCLAGDSGEMLASDYRGVPVIAVYRWLPRRELCLVVELDQAEAFASTRAFGKSILAGGGLVLLVASLLALGVARTITRPIRTIQERMIRFARGEREVRLPDLGEDEVGLLARELNALADTLSEQEIQLRRHSAQMARRNRELALLHQASEAFLATLDLDVVFVAILEKVRLLLDVVACSIWLVDQETGELVCQQVTGPHDEEVRGWRLAPGKGLVGWVATHGQSLIVPDVRADERHFKGVDEQTGLPLRSILTAPLRAKRGIIGVLQVVDAEVGRFDDRDLQLLEPLAASAAAAIENARLFERTKREIAEREQAERAYRVLVERSLQGIVVIQNMRMVFVNQAFADILGYSVKELLTMPTEESILLTHPEDRARLLQRHRDLLAGRPAPFRFEYRILRRDGQVRWVEIVSSVIQYEGQPAVQAFSVDVTERIQAQKEIRASLREKEVLLQEIHHRVKNNLQIVSSLLDFQSETVQDEAVREAFRESQNRVRSMARIHEQLYRSSNLVEIDMVAYLRDLVDFVRQSYSAYAVEIRADAAEVALGIDAAVPCGLIINELVSNAIKYAFPTPASGPEQQQGCICVALRASGEQYELRVSDDGVGLPGDLDIETTQSLGLRLVRMLTRQLEGVLETSSSPGVGTIFRITFTASGSG